MKPFVRTLSAPAEFSLVILTAFFFAIAGSLEVVVRYFLHVPQRRFLFPQQILLCALAYQLLVLALVCWLARVRGWSLACLGLKPSWQLTGLGLLLFAVTALVLNFLALP